MGRSKEPSGPARGLPLFYPSKESGHTWHLRLFKSIYVYLFLQYLFIHMVCMYVYIRERLIVNMCGCIYVCIYVRLRIFFLKHSTISRSNYQVPYIHFYFLFRLGEDCKKSEVIYLYIYCIPLRIGGRFWKLHIPDCMGEQGLLRCMANRGCV